MSKLAYRVLHVSLGLTFILLGVSIVRSPEAWGSFMQPWAVDIIGGNVDSIMMIVGIVDIVLGVLIMLNLIIWVAALIAMLHIAAVLIVTTGSFNSLIIRDIGLFGMAFYLVLKKFPSKK